MTGPSVNSPFRILRVSVTGSTNADLLARARAGEPAGLVLLADHQTAGRGRLDRRWEAPSGANLLVSMLLRPQRPVDRWFHSTLALGLAVVDACRTSGVDATLKRWRSFLTDRRFTARPWFRQPIIGDRRHQRGHTG